MTLTAQQETVSNMDNAFAIIVYGIVPELMPHRAFRRDRQLLKDSTKDIKCPYCSCLLLIVAATAKLELLRYPKKDKPKVPVDKSLCCVRCHSMIGVIYLAT